MCQYLGIFQHADLDVDRLGGAVDGLKVQGATIFGKNGQMVAQPRARSEVNAFVESGDARASRAAPAPPRNPRRVSAGPTVASVSGLAAEEIVASSLLAVIGLDGCLPFRLHANVLRTGRPTLVVLRQGRGQEIMMISRSD